MADAGEELEVRCAICGKAHKLGPVHKDYEKAEKGIKFTYICPLCEAKAQAEAKKEGGWDQR